MGMLTWKHIVELAAQLQGSHHAEGAHAVDQVRSSVIHSCETYALVVRIYEVRIFLISKSGVKVHIKSKFPIS